MESRYKPGPVSPSLQIKEAILYELERLPKDNKVFRRDANIFFLSNRDSVKRLCEQEKFGLF